MFASSGIDPRDPERTEDALAGSAIAIGILPGAHDRLLGDTIDIIATTTETLGQREDFLVTGTGRYATLYSRHLGLLGYA
jgi:hypothetical protein